MINLNVFIHYMMLQIHFYIQQINKLPKLHDEFKKKFGIPFIFAIRGKSKSDILKEFETRLKSDNIEQELDKSINQVKKIATLRLNEIIHE